YTVRHKGPRRVVDLALVNAQAHPPSTPDTARLYQAGLAVAALDGASAIFVGHNDPDLCDRPTATDDERQHLDLLHRHHREYAVGRQCAVDASVRDGDTRAWKLATTSFPSADLAKVVHTQCGQQMQTRDVNKRACVPARFLVVCEAGHLDDFPYVEFVHSGRQQPCSGPRLSIRDSASTLGPQVYVNCVECGAGRNIQQAAGRDGSANLPRCRGAAPAPAVL
ncbi:MAG: hypothetical protein ACRDS9_11345, partial [Pseudonocardiaceae bacterium]